MAMSVVDGLIELIEGMPENQVNVLLQDARRLSEVPRAAIWPARFVGIIKNGPIDGSTPDAIGAVLARGFGSERRSFSTRVRSCALANERDALHQAAILSSLRYTRPAKSWPSRRPFSRRSALVE